MIVSIPYGMKFLDIDVPDKNLLGIVESKQIDGIHDIASEIRDRLLHPIGSISLPEMVSGKKKVCIVVSDITRPVPYKVILPVMLSVIEESGVAPQDVYFLVATGLHRMCTKEELIEMLGKGIVDEYKILQHDALDEHSHSFLGLTRKGTPVWIDKRYLDAEVKIITGLVEPHFMAGFSGGRKSIAPGISALDTIKVLHSPLLLESPNAAIGVIKDNPVHEEALEIAEMAGVDFMLNVTLNKDRDITGVFAGDLKAAFYEAVDFLASTVVDVAQEVDIVISSGGGYPLDTTFYQSVKGMVAVLPAVREGGIVFVASSCTNGVGKKEFEDVLVELGELGDPELLVKRLKEPDYFKIDQWQVEEMCKVLRKADIFYYTESLSSERIKRFMVNPVEKVDELFNEARKRYGDNFTVNVVPEGPYTLLM
ncbi:MAG: nickel-dependent lactate racemase [Synergistetes bacterium]|nr:nickel-dependent lactate racemase [Synergistota bacterium]